IRLPKLGGRGRSAVMCKDASIGSDQNRDVNYQALAFSHSDCTYQTHAAERYTPASARCIASTKMNKLDSFVPKLFDAQNAGHISHTHCHAFGERYLENGGTLSPHTSASGKD